nr:garnet [Drosophila melanogaster]
MSVTSFSLSLSLSISFSLPLAQLMTVAILLKFVFVSIISSFAYRFFGLSSTLIEIQSSKLVKSDEAKEKQMIEPLQLLLLLLLLVFLFGCHCCVALQCCVSPMSIAISLIVIATTIYIYIYICYRYCYRCCCHCQLLFAIVVVQCLSLYRCLLLIHVPTFFFLKLIQITKKKKQKKLLKLTETPTKNENKTKNEPKTKPNSLNSTSAMSLLYECINTVIAVLISISSGMPNHSASIQLCVQKLRILIEDSDQNLKYLGLLAMSKILKTHPKSVQAHKDLILACLDDKDESIRLRALDLLYGMVSKKNLMEIVKRLLGHMERAEGSAYRDELLYKVIEICAQSSYLYVTNFEWYLTVLVELIQLEAGSRHGRLIAEQLLDVAIRVPVVRQFAVNEMTNLLDTFTVSAQSNSMYEVLYAAAWIVGEFAGELEDAEKTLNILLRPRLLPGHIQGVYVQNVIKLFARLATTCLELQDLPGLVTVSALSIRIFKCCILSITIIIGSFCDHVLDKLQHFNGSSDIEVQERANSACMLIEMLRNQLSTSTDAMAMDTTTEGGIPPLAIEIVQEMTLLFTGELIPVAPKAQRKVPLPDGLDLDEWINAPPPEDAASSSSSEHDKDELFVSATQAGTGADGGEKRRQSLELTPEQLERQRMARLIEQSNNPHYLKSTPTASGASNADQYDNIDDIPITELPLDMEGVAALRVGITKRSDKYLQEQQAAQGSKDGKKKHKKGKKSKKAKNKVAYNSSSESEGEPKPLHIVNTTLDMPEGVSMSDSEDKDGKYDPNDPHRALDIELTCNQRAETCAELKKG